MIYKYCIILFLLLFHQQIFLMMPQLVADRDFAIDVSSVTKNQILVHRDSDETGNKRLILMAQLDRCYSLICVKTGPIVKSLVCSVALEHSCRFYRNLTSINGVLQNVDNIVVSEKYFDILWNKLNAQ